MKLETSIFTFFSKKTHFLLLIALFTEDPCFSHFLGITIFKHKYLPEELRAPFCSWSPHGTCLDRNPTLGKYKPPKNTSQKPLSFLGYLRNTSFHEVHRDEFTSRFFVMQKLITFHIYKKMFRGIPLPCTMF